jgi:hypothetical protein
MDIRREIMFKNGIIQKENLVKMVMHHINNELLRIQMIFMFVKFVKLITFLCEYVLYEIQDIFMNKAEKYLIRNDKIYIILFT